MEQESFEDKEIADILNSWFVSIKVDREERPDIDQIYMTVCQALTGQGGWPLTILMTPAQEPFFAGTYFPKHSRQGRPGLLDILTQVHLKWEQEPDLFIKAGTAMVQELQFEPRQQPSANKIAENKLEELLKQAFLQYSSRFDKQYGGFGRAPKFPSPHSLSFLLRYWKKTGSAQALEMVEKTLNSMYRGGIYDHIGYGFSRYSTDEQWLAPHFEKMLYDNALLALAYTEAYQATNKVLYARVAQEIFTYVLRDMHAPEGGFYSAEDADSESEEGKFYLWSPTTVKEILGEKGGQLFCRLYGISSPGNFERGGSIPNLIRQTPAAVAAEYGLDLEELNELMEILRRQLFQARNERVHPAKDDKVLTAWNGLMIAALAKGAAVFNMDEYLRAAVQAADFIYHKLRRKDGRLLARYRDGEAAIPAFLDDYAFFTWGLLELYQLTFTPCYLSRALQLTEQMLDLFQDKQTGDFYFSGSDGEKLITRPKEIYDGAMPAGNSVVLLNLLRLALLTGQEDFHTAARKQINACLPTIQAYPQGYAHFLSGVDFYLGPSREIILAGQTGSPPILAMQQLLQRQFLTNTVLLFRPSDREETREIESLAPFVKDHTALDDGATAYVCQNYACLAPVTDLAELAKLLQ